MPPRRHHEERLRWGDVDCRVRVDHDYRGNTGWSRIDIQVISPEGHPLPFAESGYHTHQLDEEQLTADGGVVRFYLDWLDRASRHYRYTKALNAYLQSDLFDR